MVMRRLLPCHGSNTKAPGWWHLPPGSEWWSSSVSAPISEVYSSASVVLLEAHGTQVLLKLVAGCSDAVVAHLVLQLRNKDWSFYQDVRLEIHQ